MDANTGTEKRSGIWNDVNKSETLDTTHIFKLYKLTIVNWKFELHSVENFYLMEKDSLQKNLSTM